ncbi:hypothetical protein Acsp03_20510 [Actinomadura sp. NBRC 104412]|uniref:lysylphosphatidylglycerol synthase transmembrane domain-containing protein n=1 Tax=Actinomadura sp. NBRC 104412 TaxID=3032203 RepID=UPI0024A10B96|nr:lysylphosphatidylglycerol synthase transmembrane domain-containing protein [Actinomadura sp. NBRC 104412]GLZ04585.1 hypothetical protein Acsp03_20510 [Actinomadura sp. NBRC 104412]
MNWVRNLTGAAILGALVWWHSTDAFVNAMRMVTLPSLLAALGIGLLTTVFSAWRWCLVAHRLRLGLRLPGAVADYYQALFLNAVLPAGVLGDVHRAVSHGRDSGDVGRGVRAVVLERAAGQIVIIAAGLVVLCTRPALFTALAPGIVTVLVLVLCVVVAVVAFARCRWGRAAARATADARRVLLARDTWPGVVLLSAAALAGYIALFLVAARVAGATAPLLQLVPLVVFALLVMGLPMNVGGWGPREAATTIAFGAAGLGSEQGLAVAVVYGVLTFVASLPGAAVLLVRAGTRRRTAGARRTRPVAPRLAPQRPQVVAERLDERREKVPALAGRGQ